MNITTYISYILLNEIIKKKDMATIEEERKFAQKTTKEISKFVC